MHNPKVSHQPLNACVAGYICLTTLKANTAILGKKLGGGQKQWVQREHFYRVNNISITINNLQSFYTKTHWVQSGYKVGTQWVQKNSAKKNVPSRWVQRVTAKISLQPLPLLCFSRIALKPCTHLVPTPLGTKSQPKSHGLWALQRCQSPMFPLYPLFLPPTPLLVTSGATQ